MKNWVQRGDTVTVTAPAATLSGQGIKLGTALFGVAVGDAASGAQVEILTVGVVDLAKVQADTFAVGDKVYWNNTNRQATSTVGSNMPIGVALAAASNSMITVRVRLHGALGTV